MKVYVVVEEAYYEAFEICGVFLNKQSAVDYVKKELAKIPEVDLNEISIDGYWKCETWEYRVEDWEVQC